MARTDLALQEIVGTGLAPAYSAANVDGHAVLNRGEMFLHVKNASGAPINVTLVTPSTVRGRAVADDVVAVPAAGERMIGPFDPELFDFKSGADANKLHVNFSSVTSVTVAALKLSS